MRYEFEDWCTHCDQKVYRTPIKTGVDRAVANSPPPLADVGDDVSHMMDEGMGMMKGDETYTICGYGGPVCESAVDPTIKHARCRWCPYKKGDETYPVENAAVADIFQGKKFDGGKPDLTFLAEYFPYACEAVCLVSEFGATKYVRGGWRSVPNGFVRYTKALWRHLFKIGDLEPVPGVSPLHVHDAQVAWNSLARLEILLTSRQE